MESALYGVYTLVVLYQKAHSFASLTRSISDTPQLVCKHRTHALSMKYSIFILLCLALVFCWSIHLSKFITELKIHHVYSLSTTHDDFDSADPSRMQDACQL